MSGARLDRNGYSASRGAVKKPRSGKHQYAALGVRPVAEGGVQVLLVTSRDTGRWIIPKGWPMRGRTAPEAAMIEAYEEAGIVGRVVDPEPIGSFRYRKLLDSGVATELRVRVFLVVVDSLLEDWPERGQRRVAWFDPMEAAASVAEPALAKLIRRLPRTLAGTDLAVLPGAG